MDKAFRHILRTLCVSTTTEVFASLARLHFDVVVSRDKRRYAYRPGKHACSPLMVCHADTVVNGGETQHRYECENGLPYSIALDDRLGIACMVDAIHRKSELADFAMLVCDDEERGNSTASLFQTESQPNWLVELDRRGTDAVMYSYESPIFSSLIESCGFEIGNGSFSDICYLEHLGVCGFNVGVGYHSEHSERCFARLTDTKSQLDRLTHFYRKFGDVRLPFEPYLEDDYEDYDTPLWSDWRGRNAKATTAVVEYIDTDDEGEVIEYDDIVVHDEVDRDWRWR